MFQQQEKSIGIVKIFVLWFLTDLHVLRCPEDDFTVFPKCQTFSLCMYVIQVDDSAVIKAVIAQKQNNEIT